MPRDPLRIRPMLLLPLVLLGAGCGEALVEDSAGTPRPMTEAVWYTEHGGAESVRLEPSVGGVLLWPPQDGSRDVHALFHLEIPDAGEVSFRMELTALSSDVHGKVMVRLLVQEETAFPVLAEKEFDAQVRSVFLSADLSRYRGQSRVGVLEIATLDNAPLSTPAFIGDPLLEARGSP